MISESNEKTKDQIIIEEYNISNINRETLKSYRTGNLWDFFEKIVNKLTADLEIPFQLDNDLMRIEDTVVHKSIREALSNSLIHAQYDESGSIVIEKGELILQ